MKQKEAQIDWRQKVWQVVSGRNDFTLNYLEKDIQKDSGEVQTKDKVEKAEADFSHCDLAEVRIEETSAVHSIAVSANENIIALYNDGIIREWIYRRLPGVKVTNLIENIEGNELKQWNKSSSILVKMKKDQLKLTFR